MVELILRIITHMRVRRARKACLWTVRGNSGNIETTQEHRRGRGRVDEGTCMGTCPFSLNDRNCPPLKELSVTGNLYYSIANLKLAMSKAIG